MIINDNDLSTLQHKTIDGSNQDVKLKKDFRKFNLKGANTYRKSRKRAPGKGRPLVLKLNLKYFR